MKRNHIISVISFLALVLLDQITKYFAVLNLKNKEPIVIIQNVFELYYLENRGAAFGMLQNKRIFLLLLTIIFLLLMCYIFYKMPSEKKYIPLRILGVMVLAGAIGNMIDRLRLQYVVDFLYFKLIDFPIFNVADCYVTVAAFSLLFFVLFYYKDEDFDFLKREGK